MNLKEELSQKLYNTFEKNNLLPLVEAITNENNFISVDVYDIEVFENYRYMERLNFNNKDEIPYMKGKADKLLICFDIPTTTTLGEIATFVEYISKRFDINEIVFGTNIDSSLAKGEIVANCLIFKEYSFKDKLPKKFFKDLIKCNFIDDIDQIVNLPGIINIDIDDFKAISDSEIVGCISQYFDNLDDDFIINRISNKEPTDCVINVSGGDMLNLKDLEFLLDKLRTVYPELNIIFGSNKNDESIPRLKVQALLTYSDKPKDNKVNRENEKLLSETVKTLEEREQKWNDEVELLYSVAIYCINNPITVNGIQNEFGLGFNRTTYILDRLEKLEIISIKLGTKPREILITDKDEIKRRIDALKQE